MKVNQNISAVISNAQLHRSENKLTASIERLSSGYKINKAKDNPAGMAISNRMRAQIEALNQSSRNAADGTSVMQTADGALNETHAMLQRMRELAVQSATDTMTTSDKEACQLEIDQLKEEVDRIATDTEFNGKALLDGSQDYRVYPSVGGELASMSIRNFQISDLVSPEHYEVSVTQLAQQATMDITAPADPAPEDMLLDINGCTVEIAKGDTADQVFDKLKTVADLAGVTVAKKGANYTLTSLDYGKSTEISYRTKVGEADWSAYTKAQGADVEVTLGKNFSDTATCLTDGQKVTVRDMNGFEMVFEIDQEKDALNQLKNDDGNGNLSDPSNADPITIDLEVTEIGSMTLQIGAHENQVIDMRIPAATCEALYIDDLNVVRKGGADKAMEALDHAIAQVSSVRSRIGAYQNRLDYAVSSLDGTEENMEAAISRIMDTDMAEEMTTYSNMNVLNQAGISVLTQANDMPQQILQLLQ